MQYPKVFNDQKLSLVSEVQSVKKVDETNLIINYLPADMTENELFELFSKIGEVAKHKIVRNRRTGENLGYGFVEFKNASAARIAQNMCNGHVIRGKSLKVAFARPQSEDITNANLYVTYLPPDVDESKLATLFGCYGTIIEVKILRSKLTGKPRGTGFVRFDQRLAAEVAKNALDNYVLKNATRPISVKIANGAMKPPLPEPEIEQTAKRFPLATNRQMERENEQTAKRSQEPYPFRPPNKRKMEPEIEQTAKRFQEPCHFPLAINRQMEPEIEQTAKRGQEPYPFPLAIKRQMEPEIEQIAKRFQEPCHFPLAIKRQMEPEIEQTAKHRQEPYPFPLAIKRQMEPEIEQTAKRSQSYPFAPLVNRQMEYNIQQPEMQQDANRSQAFYPSQWIVKRSVESEIEQIDKRACGYADPYTK